MTTGYLYRRHPLSAAELRAFAAERIFTPAAGREVQAFAGHSYALTPIQPCASALAIPVHDQAHGQDYEFGHIFSDHAELRWRRGAQGYDALLLTEAEQPDLAKYELRAQARYTVRPAPGARAAILLDPAPPGTPESMPNSLDYVEYYAPNGAVQLVRYAGRKGGAR